MIKLIFVNSLAVFFLSCSISNVNQTLNDWQSNYNHEEFWYGVAVINNNNQSNVHDIARNQAIIDIASQIKVEINQKYSRKLSENNYSITDYTVQELNSKVENNFENIEILDYKSIEDSYLLLARLSKKKYNSTLLYKKNKTKKAVLDLLQQSKDPSLQSIYNLSQSIELLVPYIDNPIYYFSENENHDLFYFVNKKINEILDRINIESELNIISIKSMNNDDINFDIKIFDSETNKALNEIPLYLNVNDNITNCISDEAGICRFQILNKHLSKNVKQYGFIGLDTKNLFINQNEKNSQLHTIEINVSRTNLFLSINEKNLEKVNYNSTLVTEVSKYFVENFNVKLVNSEEDCDVKILIDITSQKKGDKPNEYGLYQSIVRANIYLFIGDKSSFEISIKENGIDFNSFHDAYENGLNKIKEKFLDETLDELVSILIQN